jgi:hypothetical protein
MENLSNIEVGSQVYLKEGADPCGAVRQLAASRNELTIYIENAGDFVVPVSAIRSAHDGKVILDPEQSDQSLLDAIAHAHDREVRGL